MQSAKIAQRQRERGEEKERRRCHQRAILECIPNVHLTSSDLKNSQRHHHYPHQFFVVAECRSIDRFCRSVLLAAVLWLTFFLCSSCVFCFSHFAFCFLLFIYVTVGDFALMPRIMGHSFNPKVVFDPDTIPYFRNPCTSI